MDIRTVEWASGKVRMIDQTLLPSEEVFIELETVEEVANSICTMQVRGAPAIGVTAALGVALAAHQYDGNAEGFEACLLETCDTLAATRPTAVNLFWAIEKMKQAINETNGHDLEKARENIIKTALEIADEDEHINRAMGSFGNELVPDGATILTHCNAGSLATAYYGTALGVVRAAHEAGKNVQVFADETRPLLQGARLTAWELGKIGVKTTLISDNMAAYVMSKGMIDIVIVGADRIAGNGDVANKIGTYGVALAAARHDIPFYVAAPTSTVDLSLKSGSEIPIEERHHEEVTHIKGINLAPEGVNVFNPAFDVTPNELVSAIITEKGIARHPYETSLSSFING